MHTTPATRAEPSSDNYALAYAQRRSWVMWSWMYGGITAAAGGVYALVALAAGTNPETGVGMLLLGLALAALGWLTSAPKRFSRKDPKPAMDIARAEQAIRINKGVALGSNALMAAIVLGLALATPRGLTPDTLPVLAMLSVWAPLTGAGILRTRRLLMERGARYERWIQSR
jgi:hypothetical protein